jgi:hypothetical protein
VEGREGTKMSKGQRTRAATPGKIDKTLAKRDKKCSHHGKGKKRLMGEKEREAGSKFELDDEIRVALVGGMCAAWHCRVID